MNTNTILQTYHLHNYITDEVVNSIQDDDNLRLSLVDHFRHHQDREFAVALLKQFIAIRLGERTGVMPFENLMFACYLLTLHNQIEDCLLIWEAKYADFDTYCGLDTQLVVFAGVTETMDFLTTQKTEAANIAFKYIVEYREFEDLEEYFAPENLPWWI
jgi:hypothetical protein